MTSTSRVSTCLWFDREAEEAARFYVSLLPNSRIGAIARYGKGAPLPEGTVLTVAFALDGRDFLALNGGPVFAFNEAHSMVVACESQAEIDRLWAALLANGGAAQRCGWLKDRYGLSWQIVPASLAAMMAGSDTEARDRAMAAVLGMVKLDIAAIAAAYRGA